MEAKKEESEFLEETLNRVPRPIYIGKKWHCLVDK